jgi:hypothetical protein
MRIPDTSAMVPKERAVPVAATCKIDVNLRHFPKPYWNYLLVTALFGIGNSNLVSDPANKGHWRFFRGDHVDLLCLQLCGRADFLSGGFSFQLVGQKTRPSTFVHPPPHRLSRFCECKERPLIATLFFFYALFQGMFRSIGKAFARISYRSACAPSGVGWYGTTVGLLGLMANIVAGLLWNRVGLAAVFYYCATFAIVGSVGLLVLAPEGQNNHRRKRPDNFQE